MRLWEGQPFSFGKMFSNVVATSHSSCVFSLLVFKCQHLACKICLTFTGLTDDALENAKLVSPSINCDWFTCRHLCGLQLCKIDTLASFNRRRRMKAESRQIPQKLAARLKFVYSQWKPWYKARIMCFNKSFRRNCIISTWIPTSGSVVQKIQVYFRSRTKKSDSGSRCW